MSRHRSPRGRRVHREPPLPASPPAAGVGAAHRSPGFVRGRSLRTRAIGTAVAGSALAVAGQAALVDALPEVAAGDSVLRVSVQELIGQPARPNVPAAAPVEPVAAEPAVATADDLAKAVDLEQAAAEAARAAEEARLAAEAAAAEQARAAEAEQSAGSSVGGAVQMLAGRVTSGFGARWGSQHRGLDIAAPIGTPIRVPLGGTVVDSGPASGFGMWVRVRHDDGHVTVYGHINRALVSVGEVVSAGQVVAEVGNRGRSTGPHLHLEVVTPAGNKIDPRPWLDERAIGYT